MSKIESSATLVSEDDSAHRYANSRPFTVFGLATIAALGASSLVWGAWSVLEHAESSEMIASPPDLKLVVDAIGDSGRTLANSSDLAELEASEGEGSFSGEDTDHEQAVDQSI